MALMDCLPLSERERMICMLQTYGEIRKRRNNDYDDYIETVLDDDGQPDCRLGGNER